MPLRPSTFAKIQRPLYLWNLMIRDSTNDGFFTETLKLYSFMHHSGVHGNTFTYPLLLKSCANLLSIPHGTMLHGHVLRLGFQADTFVQTALVDMYSKCSVIESARKVFDEMPQRSVVSWNAVISAYCHESLMNKALSLLKEMLVVGFEPSSSTFVSILSGYSSDLHSLEFLWQSMLIHCFVVKLGLVCYEVSLDNSLMGMYAQFGQMDEARKVFEFSDEKSIVSWTTIMGGYVKVGCTAEAFKLFNQIQYQNIDIDFVVFLNLISGCIQSRELLLASSVHSLVLKCGCDEEDSIENLLITMYANCGNLTSARRIFDAIIGKSVVSWTSMIAGYAHSGHLEEALGLFRRMVRTEVKPNGATLATILSACADLGSLSIGQEIEQYVFENGFELDQQVQTSLIHMYSKCGSINKSREVFERVKNKDLTLWTSMINSYALHGMGNEAISLFGQMTTSEGIKPDAIVYTSLLFACSHSGLIEDGLKYFKSMQTDFGITPTVEHYTCLVDLLSRVGQLDLALDAVEAMPQEVQAKALGPLLSACRIHGNVELGELAAAKLLDVSPRSSASYVLMANLYNSVGKWNEANTMRNSIGDKGLVKECGWSQVQVSV
ncbi:pentatricopeptide repeat-containing protein DOT4, chloroplastic-like [Vicia villosa]|uniref:pentatricopeptide repeat-containing protein DOT4, chloroplastic-like n=1 Tax=Vicia villosa TaxID=3911 RepID=UPI00273B1F44|nr:pentatricopeptide repeat-containing protein DOT4, chloroplastic-like [Vicia villosa]